MSTTKTDKSTATEKKSGTTKTTKAAEKSSAKSTSSKTGTKTSSKTTAKSSSAKTSKTSTSKSSSKTTASKIADKVSDIAEGKKVTVANETVMKTAAAAAAATLAASVVKSKKSKNSKSGKKSGVLKTIWIPVVILILFGVWFVYGKPTVEIGAEGFTVVQSEEPIINHVGEIVKGEYPPETNYAEINGTENPSVPTSSGETVATTAADTKTASSTGTKSASGTTGSFAGDSGHSENDPLYFGNPTDALEKTSSNTNYLMTKKQYTLSYNTETLCPNWVAWHLCKSDLGDADRSNDFRPDEDLPSDWYEVKKADYQYNTYGYDRGHVCPSADRTATSDDNSMTFLMTNMVPQSPDNNRVIWMHFECYERELVEDGKEAYIIAGPYGTGGTGAKGTFDSIPVKTSSGEVLNMNVPAYTWKVLILLDEGSGDISRVDENTTVIAINIPNQMGMAKTGDWEQYITTIDEIESLTGYDFFELLPDSVEDKLEAKKYVYSE